MDQKDVGMEGGERMDAVANVDEGEKDVGEAVAIFHAALLPGVHSPGH